MVQAEEKQRQGQQQDCHANHDPIKALGDSDEEQHRGKEDCIEHIAVALLIGFAVRLTILGDPRAAPTAERPRLRRLSAGLGVYVAILCAINFVSVLVQCGFGQCHTTGYALLP